VLRNRIDGVLHVVATMDSRLLPALVAEWKRLAGCNVQDAARPQDGRILIRLAQWCPGLEEGVLDLRISFLPTHVGEASPRVCWTPARYASNWTTCPTARTTASASGAPCASRPASCSVRTHGQRQDDDLCSACVQALAGPGLKVMSVEDPVEYLLPWVTQVAVQPGMA